MASRIRNQVPTLGRVRLATLFTLAFTVGFGHPFIGNRVAEAQTFGVLHEFAGPPDDGANPSGKLVRDADGNFYGTTSHGGPSNVCLAGCGTVFKVDAVGMETVLYSFKGAPDGAVPLSGLLVDASGNLYGTTSQGGTADAGTVFKVDPAGTETVLYSFTGGADGNQPLAGLVRDSAGNLYGTTRGGGITGLGCGGGFGAGVVFKLDTNGTQTVVHSFAGGNDGAIPQGGLVQDTAGHLYGATQGCSRGSSGTVFKLDSNGGETVLYSGANPGPTGDLALDAAGNLYGTFSATSNSPYGTVFKLDSAGTLTQLHSFTGGPADGVNPNGGLVLDSAGNLYGTTSDGGLPNCGDPVNPKNCGTVFKLDSSGTETVYAMDGSSGAYPAAGLFLDAAGTLYGTAPAAGPSTWGTVFTLNPGPPDFSLAVSAFTPTTISPGGSSTSTVSVTGAGGFADPVSLSCSVWPMPALAPGCSVSSSVAPGSSVTLTVSTTGSAAVIAPFSDRFVPLYAACFPLLGLVLAGMRTGSGRRDQRKLLAAVLIGVALAGASLLTGCGGGSHARGSSGTPKGSYSITVTAHSGSLTHSTTTTLTVQ